MLCGRRKFLALSAMMVASLLRPCFALPSTPKTERDSNPLEGVKEKEQLTSLTSIDHFLSEKVHYDLSFLWFSKAAIADMQFVREGKGYKAILQAETKGFVGFFTSYRKHTYISHLVYSPEKKKFRVTQFERYVTIKKKEEKTITYLDYDAGIISWVDYKYGKLIEEKAEAMPDAFDYEDVLSAFYNFRMGVFGPIRRDRSFQVQTLPEKGVTTIDVNIANAEASNRSKRMFGEGFNKKMFHVKVKVPKEIFSSKRGEVDIWLDEKVIPLKGVVKDYIGFGDIKGTLKKV